MSLRTRVALIMALGIILALVLQGALGYLAFQRLVLNDMNHDLDGFTSKLAQNIEQSSELDTLQASYEGYVVHARIMKGQQVMHNLTNFPTELTPLQFSSGYHTIGQWRVTQVPFEWEGQSLTLHTALTSPEFTAGLRNYRETTYFTALMVTTLGAVVAYLLSAFALRPLRTLTRVSSQIATSGSLQMTVPVGGQGSGEIHELALSFNKMLTRLTEFRAREARFNRQAAHELRTPLTAMSLALDTAEEGHLTPAEAYAILRDEVGYTKRLTASLLILAREGTLDDSERVDLAVLAQAGAKAFGAQYLGLANAWIEGDSALLRRALENLLENAARYAPDSVVTVTVSRRNGTREGVELTVEDRGQGLPDEAMPRLSEEFYRAGQANISGSGLGLSVVRYIVGAHQGHLSFEHAEPHGLRVKVWFPGFLQKLKTPEDVMTPLENHSH